MNVSGAGKYAALYLYAGSSPAIKTAASASTGATKTPTTSGDIVQISDEAKAASVALSDSATTSKPTLKQKVDAIYNDARARGTSVTLDFSKPGEPLDVSSFTDDELAKIANDKDSQFPTDLSDYARGALNARVQVTLQPYEYSVQNGDRRG